MPFQEAAPAGCWMESCGDNRDRRFRCAQPGPNAPFMESSPDRVRTVGDCSDQNCQVYPKRMSKKMPGSDEPGLKESRETIPQFCAAGQPQAIQYKL
jgi:hypothetical protein